MTTAVDERPVDVSEGPAERPVHLAKCAECAHAVRFRPSPSGSSFVLVDATPEASYGIGEHGRPTCPDGHGEMEIADDQLKPASEAIADVTERLAAAAGHGAEQRVLPGVLPPFNFEGAARELTDQATKVNALKLVHLEDARKAKESKKKWDDAEELLTAMGLKFAERIRQRDKGLNPDDDEAPAARSPRLVKCTWERLHPEETCPICDDREFLSPMILEDVFGNVDALPPADAEAHVEIVDRLHAWLEVRETIEALENVDTFIPRDVIAAWTPDERKAVTFYADQQLDIKNGVLETDAPLDRPAVLGRAHIPARADGDGRQVCTICDQALARDPDDEPYRETDFVGVDCPGKAPKAKGPDHHYPEKGKKKSAKKAGKKT